MTDTTLNEPAVPADYSQESMNVAYSNEGVAKRVRGAVGIVNEDEMAAILQISHETLATWRTRRRGPPSIKLGKKVFYAVADFGEWVREEVARQRVPQCKPAQAAPRPFKPVPNSTGDYINY